MKSEPKGNRSQTAKQALHQSQSTIFLFCLCFFSIKLSPQFLSVECCCSPLVWYYLIQISSCSNKLLKNVIASVYLLTAHTHTHTHMSKELFPFCLENALDRGVQQATAHGVAKSRKRPSDFTFTFSLSFKSTHTHTHTRVQGVTPFSPVSKSDLESVGE